MKKNTFCVSLLAFSILPLSVSACEQCPHTLDLPETIAEADLVIVGKKAGTGELTSEGNPEWIELQVNQVLKGTLDAGTVQVSSGSGMCGYGIYLPDARDYIVFLEKGRGTDIYTSVADGCGRKTYPLEAGEVEVNGEKMPLGAFAIRYVASSTDTALARGEGSKEETQGTLKTAASSQTAADAADKVTEEAPENKHLPLYIFTACLGSVLLFYAAFKTL